MSAEKSNDPGIKYSDVDSSRVVVGTPGEKTVKSIGSKYYSAEIGYNFGTSQNPLIKEFLLDAPELTCLGGIQTKEKKDAKAFVDPKTGKETAPPKENSMMVVYDQGNSECKKFVEVMTKVYEALTAAVEKNDAGFQKPGFKKEMAEMLNFKNPIYWPKDKLTKKRIEGKSPSQWLKLYDRRIGNIVDRTLFSDLKGKPIDWSLLRGVKMTFIPRLLIKSLYANGILISMQIEVRSAVVTSVKRINSVSEQKNVLDELNKNRPGLSDELEQQLAALKMTDGLDVKDNKSTSTPSPQEQQQSQQSQNNTPVVTVNNTQPNAQEQLLLLQQQLEAMKNAQTTNTNTAANANAALMNVLSSGQTAPVSTGAVRINLNK